MGFLDDVLERLRSRGGGSKLLRHNVRTGEKLLAEGEQGTAQICGIRVRAGHRRIAGRPRVRARLRGHVPRLPPGPRRAGEPRSASAWTCRSATTASSR